MGKYKNPSVIEAVFEVRFPSDNDWGMSSFVKFAKAAEKAGYSEVVDAGEAFQFSFQSQEKTIPEVKPISRRIQTWNKSKNELWQASPDLYAANRREPYLGWENFRAHIFKGLDIYSKLAKPKKALQASLHYVNRIKFDEDPSEYVLFVPPMFQYADTFQSFTCHTHQTFKSGDSIIVSSSKDPAVEKRPALILNIVYTTPLPSLDRKSLKTVVEKGHEVVIKAFEKSITDKQRERMAKL